MKDFSRSLRDLVDGAAGPVSPQEAVLRSRHGAAATGEGEAEQLWLDDDRPPARRRGASRQRLAATVAVAVCLVAIAVPVVVLAGGSRSHAGARGDRRSAERHVLTALSATTDSGSFDFSYDLSSTPATKTLPTTTITQCVEEPVNLPITDSPYAGTSTGPTVQTICGSMPQNSETDVTGSGVIDTNPMAMVASAAVGSGGLDVVVRIDPQNVYEFSDTGDAATLAPPPSEENASGQPLSGFASLVESTLGSRNGAVAMMGMASPTGYLDLYQQDISGAMQTGTSTVDGTPVTVYRVTQDLGQVTSAPGTSAEEAKTVAAALTVLDDQGYGSDTVDISIDGAGYIRKVSSTLAFGDGSTSTLEATFSNFGCAGTVLMPGQQGSGTPPSGCSSPDSGTGAQSAGQTPTSSGATTPTSSASTTPRTEPAGTGSTQPAGTGTTGPTTPTTVASSGTSDSTTSTTAPVGGPAG